VEEEVSITTLPTLASKQDDCAGARKSGGAERDGHTQGGDDGTDNFRKPIQAEKTDQQRDGNEHRARDGRLFIAP